MTGLVEKLVAQADALILKRDLGRIVLLGGTPVALEVHARLSAQGLGERLCGVFDPEQPERRSRTLRAWHELATVDAELLIICSDERKESLLEAYEALVGSATPIPDVAIAGLGHLRFDDATYAELDAPALVPSYATGYPFTRVHIFQCLAAAAANNLSGAIVEFGCFKGGTTAWLARCARRLGLNSRVIGFDSFDGFPPPRSVLDLYTHPRCVFREENEVRGYLEPLGVEVVAGDISNTAPARLRDEPVLLAFVDTDNYTPASAALAVVADNLVAGGSIVLDHWTTTEDYVYTVGERIAARRVLAGRGFLQLHGTGVWVRLL